MSRRAKRRSQREGFPKRAISQETCLECHGRGFVLHVFLHHQYTRKMQVLSRKREFCTKDPIKNLLGFVRRGSEESKASI